MADERRLTNRMIAKWSTVSRGNRLPRYDDLDINVFGKDLPYCLTVELATEIGDSELIYTGEALRNETWTQGGRQIVSDYPTNSLLCLTAAKIAAVIAKRGPIIFGGTGVCDVSAILYRAILLPMSDDGKIISHVVGAINFREITAVEEYSDIAVAPPTIEELTPAERLVAFASRRMIFAPDVKKVG
jgi:hypothetical protein